MTPMTPKSRAIASNAIFSMTVEVSIALLFFLNVMAARYLGDEQFGKFSFTLAYVNLFTFLMEAGLSHIYTRTVSRNQSLNRTYLGNVVVLQVAMCTIGVVSAALVLSLLGKDQETTTLVYLMLVAEGLRVIKQLYRAVFRTASRYDLEAVTVYIERSTLLAVGFFVLVSGNSVVWLGVAFVVGRMLDVIVTVLLHNRFLFAPKPLMNLPLWQNMSRQAMPLMLTILVMMLLYKIDSVMLSVMRTDAEVGWYGAAYRIMEGLLLFSRIFGNTLFPQFSESAHNLTDLTWMYQRALKYIFFLAMPITLLGIAASEDVILKVYGDQYTNAIPALQILLLVVPSLFINDVSFVLMTALNRQRVTFSALTVALILDVILNLILIPRIGFLGAPIALFISQSLYVAIVLLDKYRYGFRIPYLKLLVKPFTAAAAAAMVYYLVNKGLIIGMPIAGAVYLVLTFLMGFWDQKEIALTRKFVGRLRKLALRSA